jgi:hypothetical protein
MKAMTALETHEMAQRITALAVSILGDFITAPETPRWAATLERLERKVREILEEQERRGEI